jgi:alpha-L-arabinofuranosidase
MATEDKNRQATICRQSNLKWILDYSKQINTNFTLEEMIRFAEALTIYCIDGRTNVVKEIMSKADEHIIKKFEEK